MSTVAVTTGLRTDSRSFARVRFALFGLASVVAASIANVLVFYVGNLFVHYDPAFVELGSAIGIGVFTLFCSIGAVPVYGLILHSVKRPERVFTIVSVVALVLSIVPDITYIPTVEGASIGQTGILILMHIVAAAVIVGMLTSYTRQRAS
jgi:hypothetical protein